MELPEATTILARTPPVLGTLLRGLSQDWLHRNDGPGTWSAYDIVGHLVHGEATNWIPRIRMILAHGTDRPFEPFDREAMLGWERETAEALTARLQSARRASLDELLSLGLTPDDLGRRGAHPEMGEVTLGRVLAAWVAHDLTHLAQVGEVLARRYRDDVGPYRRYMPALDGVAEAE
jgi:uncharacterized damage-inducible protein DinB